MSHDPQAQNHTSHKITFQTRDCLATGGRDKNLKIWNTSESKAKLDSLISTLGPVGRVRWRPNSRMQIAR